MTPDEARVAAQLQYADGDCDISDDADVQEVEDGFWVTAYVFVHKEDEEPIGDGPEEYSPNGAWEESNDDYDNPWDERPY